MNQNQTTKRNLFLILGIAIFLILLLRITWLQPLIIYCAPTALLIAITFACVKASSIISSIPLRLFVIVSFFIVAGLNTRLPSLTFDLLNKNIQQNITGKLQIAVGQPIFLDSNINKIEFRMRPYDMVSARCNFAFFFCHKVTGFAPIIGLNFEDPISSIQSFGYSLAKPEQEAPRLIIRATEEKNFLHINQVLLDESGVKIASETRRYRNSFPFESYDLRENHREKKRIIWFLEYMLHGNILSKWVGRSMGFSDSYPVGKFINNATERYVPQDDQKFIQFVEPTIVSDVEFNPSKKLSDSNWTEYFYDKIREEACATVIEPQQKNINVPDFTVDNGIMGMSEERKPYKFINEKTGNKTILLNPGDDTLCDGKFFYQLARTNNYSQYEISKYKYDGTLVYRVGFKKPESISPSLGSIRDPSFLEIDGLLKFEFVDFKNSASERSISRIRSMSLTPSQKM